MSPWVTPPIAAPESVVWEKRASHPQRRRLVGGRLYLTQQRLVFQPNRLEKATGALTWSAALQEITAIGPEPAWRPRLRIDLTQRTAERFWVTRLEDTGRELVDLINRLR
jgi:hypothetical protein